MARFTVSPLDYPVPDGRPVTEAHALYCKANGHATWITNGEVHNYCPRCNARLPETSPNLCRHGRNIGSPNGPDYLCGDCEDGNA